MVYVSFQILPSIIRNKRMSLYGQSPLVQGYLQTHRWHIDEHVRIRYMYICNRNINDVYLNNSTNTHANERLTGDLFWTILLWFTLVNSIADITPAIRSIFHDGRITCIRRGPLLTSIGYSRLAYEWIIIIVVCFLLDASTYRCPNVYVGLTKTDPTNEFRHVMGE